MAVWSLAIGDLSPSIKGAMEGVFALTLQSLQAELTFQGDLVLIQVRLTHHPAHGGQQAIGIEIAALEADQDAVFMGVTAQSGTATFHKISQLQVIKGATAAAEHGSQQLMPAALTLLIATTATADPQLG